MHPDLGKGGAGLSEALGGVTLRDLLANHQEVVTANVETINQTIQQIVIDGANVQATGDYFEATAGQTIFSLSAEPLGRVEVRVNGSDQIFGRDFDVIGSIGARQIFWHSPDFALADEDIVIAAYIRVAT